MKSESEHDLFYTWIKNWIPKFEAVIEIGVATGGSTKVWHSFLDKDGIFIGIDINLVDNNFLDGKHPVFGKVIEGMDVVNQISKVQTDANDKPLQDIIIEKAEMIK